MDIMIDTLPETGAIPEILLESFTQSDFEAAKASLLTRYRLWHGVLLNVDGSSIITSDDMEAFKEQANDISEQELHSEHEMEQIKILVVLIYLLISADKEASPTSDSSAEDFANFPHARNFIIRKILYQSNDMAFEDIETLLAHQNQFSSSDDTQSVSASSVLKSKDNFSFILRGCSGNYSAEIVTEEQPDTQIAEEATPVKKFRRPKPVLGVKPLILRNNEKARLNDTISNIALRCGVNITAASYKGHGKERNEDGIVVIPESNQLIVMDALGAYKNGPQVRDIFIDKARENPRNIDKAVFQTQIKYDEEKIPRGGVCIIDLQITVLDDHFGLSLAQAGDVHAVLFDEDYKLRYESSDEAIGHRVLNAITSLTSSIKQRKNGWNQFGRTSKTKLTAHDGWRMAIYSDGISNHFNAKQIVGFLHDTDSNEALAKISDAVHEAMAPSGSYRDNCSLAIIDF